MTRLLAAVALAACSSHGTPTHPTPARADAGAPVAVTGPSDAECDSLFDHAIALRSAGDPKITDDDRVKLRAELREHSLARCRAMPRAAYTCAVGATTLDAFTACDDPGTSPAGGSAQR